MNARDLDRLGRLLRREAGIVLAPSESYAIERRLGDLVAHAHAGGLGKLLDAVETGDRELARRVCEAVTVHETRFFRDERMFKALAGTVLPELVRTRRQLRIWCGAIASGQEPYSVAMTLRDFFPGVRATITGTDLSQVMVERARRAVYSDFEVNRGLTTAQRARHLAPIAGGWEIRPELRAMVDFSPVNLAGPWPNWQKYDLVFLRNVLVYLDDAVRTRIIERTRALMADDGVLVLGATEILPTSRARLARTLVEDATFYRPVQETP